MAEITIVEQNEMYDVVKITNLKNPEKIHVISGEIVESTSDSIELKLKQNDALSIGGEIYLWWNRAKKCFVRQ